MARSMSEAPNAVRRISVQDYSIIEKILRNRQNYFNEIREGIELPEKMRAMLISSITFFALYGAVMGSSHSLWQTMSSAVKLPILFVATLFVCVPSLYFFSLLFGSNQSLGQNFAVILTAITVTGVLLLSCAPITLFFLLTTSQYQFFKLLNVAIFAVAGLMGIVFLYQGMKIVSGGEKEGRWDAQVGFDLLDVRVRLRGQPDGLDDPAVHRRAGLALRAVPPAGRQFLHQYPAKHR